MKQSLALCFVLFTLFISSFGQYTGSNSNIAAFASTEASDSITGHGPTRAVDTVSSTYWSVSGSSAWILIDLGSSYYVDGYSVKVPDALALPRSITLQLSSDGVIWNDNQTISISADGEYPGDIAYYAPVQFIRLNITDMDATASISEIEIYGMVIPGPEVPTPLAPTLVGQREFTANWSSVDDAYGYTLYVATDAAMTDRLPGYMGKDVGYATSWEVTGLDPASTYYYRVKSYNVNGTSEWSHAMEATTLKYDQVISFGALEAKMYGDASFTLDASSDMDLDIAFSCSDPSVATVDGNTVTIVGSGTCTILADQAGNDTVNAALQVGQQLLVEKKALTVSGTTVSDKVYDGNRNAQLVGSVLEGTIAGDDVYLSYAQTGTFAQADAGTDIEVSAAFALGGTDKADYEIITQTTLSGNITKAQLTVTAQDMVRDFCDPNPTYLLVITGFIAGEDETFLDVVPAGTCEAGSDSPAGDYDIIPSGGSSVNYDFTYVNGTLTINPDESDPVLSVHSIEVVLDPETGQVTITPDMVINVAEDDCGIVDTILSQEVFTYNDLGGNVITVTVFDAAGNSTSANVTVTVSAPDAINDALLSGIRAYPNPTSGVLDIEFTEAPKTLKVMDMTGRVVLELTNISKEERFDMDDFKNGIYVFQFNYGDHKEYIKVVKR